MKKTLEKKLIIQQQRQQKQQKIQTIIIDLFSAHNPYPEGTEIH